MKRTFSIQALVLFITLAALLLTAAVPAPVFAASDDNLVRLTVDNRDGKRIVLSMKGPTNYWLTIPGDTLQTFTVERGEYTYTVFGCGTSGKGTLTMTKPRTLLNPICGGNMSKSARKAGKIDLSKQLKVVRIAVINDAPTTVLAILVGPEVYVFRLTRGKAKEFTVAEGTYNVKYYACDGTYRMKFKAEKFAELELDCP